MSALRPKTLPLAVGGILLGSFLPEVQPHFSWVTCVLAVITAASLQILSNLANDYGDFIKGTDNDNRVGPIRALQSGLIKEGEMLRAMYLCGAICLVSGLALVFVSLGPEQLLPVIGMIAVGLFAIWAAIRYTVGKKPYGYTGLGDFFVLFFFGIVSVWGVSYLYTKNLEPLLLLPALSYGFLSAAVLNINNMRDMENDLRSKKFTLAVKLGPQNARVYHGMLIAVSLFALWFYLVFMDIGVVARGLVHYRYVALVAFIPVIVNTILVLRPKESPAEYNRHLKGLALSSLFVVVAFVSLLRYFVS